MLTDNYHGLKGSSYSTQNIPKRHKDGLVRLWLKPQKKSYWKSCFIEYVLHLSQFKTNLIYGPLLRATCFKAVSQLSVVRDRFFCFIVFYLYPIFGGHTAFVTYGKHELLEKWSHARMSNCYKAFSILILSPCRLSLHSRSSTLASSNHTLAKAGSLRT